MFTLILSVGEIKQQILTGDTHYPSNCGMYIPLSDDKYQWSETAQKNALASMDVIVTQLLRYHMPLLYFVWNHLIL